ncbi:hypothetical protein CMV30_09565 [Nibricoccus aquaticus]|uniref:Outer membrane protein beta-barrel domain-containing protein n=1 Tax=Nibricoccus aquaticus TaxID=2576891 RepID=A0A290QJY6_9BACT|nr:hypothetical protein [Nibricoccus aquaticus]ATC64182.1 hypothetical protein CMV30_09565 [Nibricoccus aquaticus]
MKPSLLKPAATTAALLVGLACVTAHAQEIPAPTSATEPSRFALVVEGGTVGFGPSVIYTINPKWTVTVGYTWLDHNYDVESDDNKYDGKLKLSNFKALANYHPWGGSFHFSGGVFATDNKIDVTLRPTERQTYKINGNEYSSTFINSLGGSATFEDDIAPYVGIGWAKNPANSGFSFYATLGVFFAGDASANLTATGPITLNPQFQSDLRAEERDINDDLEDLGAYPVAQLGVLYRF